MFPVIYYYRSDPQSDIKVASLCLSRIFRKKHEIMDNCRERNRARADTHTHTHINACFFSHLHHPPQFYHPPPILFDSLYIITRIFYLMIGAVLCASRPFSSSLFAFFFFILFAFTLPTLIYIYSFF